MPGGPEWIFVFLVIIVLFGAKKLPELARALGKSALEFKKAKQEFDDELSSTTEELRIEEPKNKKPYSQG